MTKIEMGKKYKTRDGKCDVEILKIAESPVYPVIIWKVNKSTGAGHVCYYTLDGKQYRGDCDSDEDLVEVKTLKYRVGLDRVIEIGGVGVESLFLVQTEESQDSCEMSPYFIKWITDWIEVEA